MAEPARKKPEDENRKPIKPTARGFYAIPGEGETNGKRWGEGKLRSVPDQKSSSLEALRNAEASSSGADDTGTSDSAVQERKSLGAATGEKSFYRNEGKSGFLAKFKGKGLLRKRNLIIAGGAGGLAVAAVLLFLFFSSLLIPGLAQHIAEWQLARVSRQFADTVSTVNDEALGMEAESADRSVYNSIKERFGSTTAGTKTKEMWSKFDKYRPSKAIEKLKVQNGLKFNEVETSWGGTALQGVELNGTSYEFAPKTFTRFIPGVSQVISFKNDVQFSKQFAPALSDSLREREIGMIVRSSAAKDIRQKLGIGLIAWTVGKYAGKNQQEARLQQAKDTEQAIDQGNAPDTAVTEDLKNAEEAAGQAEKQCVSDDKCLQTTIDNGGIVPGVKDAVNNTLKDSFAKSTVGAFTAYGVAMPLCIIYDGSLNQAGPTIDAQTAQQQRSFYYLSSAADQQKFGSPKVDTEAISAFNQDVNPYGQVVQSNPEVRADGGTVDTTAVPSAEASSSGEFTLLNATLPSAAADTINSVAKPLCPYLTNIYISGLAAIAGLGIGIFTGGTADAAGEAATISAREAISNIISGITDRFAAKIAEEGAVKGVTKVAGGYYGRRFANLVWDSAKQAAVIAGFTVLAKMIVMSQAAQVNSGLSQQNDLVNEADAGGNIHGNEVCRFELYCRPLTLAEIIQAKEQDKQYLALQNSKRSAYDRYFAMSNADSLMYKSTASIYKFAYSKPVFSSIFTSFGKILNPNTLAASLTSSFSNKMSMAANDSDTEDYGNVQFGWSQQELALIHGDQSYRPLENSYVLDHTQCDASHCWAGTSGGTNAYDYMESSKFSKCFSESTTLGDMFSSRQIVRDDKGNVIADQGDCSPQNLGPSNPNFGDIVMRWRLSHAYSNALDQYSQIQALTSSTSQ